MPVYDDENKDKDLNDLTPDALSNLEDKYSSRNDEKEDEVKDKGDDSEDQVQEKEPGKPPEEDEDDESDEDDDINERLQKGLSDAKEKDSLASSKGKGGSKRGGKLRKLFRRKGVLAGASIGVVGLVVAVAGLFGFLNVFKLDHLLQNMDSASFSRFNASFSGRSDKYVQAYIQLRLNEIDGTQDHDTLLFRANKVDTNNPVRDWYRTLRTSSFEKEVFGKQGIYFTSIAVQNLDGSVTLRPAQIDFTGRPDLKQTFEARIDGKNISGRKYTNAGGLSADLSKYAGTLDKDTRSSIVTVFKSDEDARRNLKKTVQNSTRFNQVIKRRHVRKDIQNLTGISSWKFFETSRNKFTASKIRLQQKIVRKIVPDTTTGKFIKCILGAGNCVASNDPAAPENRSGAIGAGTLDPADSDQAPTEQINPDGTVATTKDANGNVTVNTTGEFTAPNTASEIAGGIENVVKNEVGDETEKIVLSPSKKIIADQINSFVGGNIYTKAWSWAKKLTKIHNNIVNSKFSKLVKQARLTQLAAIYTTYAIARDQAKTGQVNSDEVNLLMQTLGNSEHSEGWMSLMNKDSNTVSAQGSDNTVQAKNENDYCKLSETDKKEQKVQYFCQRPNGDSNALSIETAYRNSPVFDLLNGIATAVNGINDSPIGSVINSISNIADSIISKVLDPVISTVLNATGAQNKLQTVMAYAMSNIMSFLGAGPMWDGDQAGGLNYLLAGSSATAETSTRGSGGAKSTPETKAYTSGLAAAYEDDENLNKTFMERFASLDNQKSLASNAVYGIATINVGKKMSSIFSTFSSIPTTLLSIFSGKLFAAQNQSFDAAKWSGVDEYDIPYACQILDPLDTEYATKAVGVIPDSPFATQAQAIVDKMRPKLTLLVERDNIQFWDLVYTTIDDPESSENLAGAIYNCALLDARVMGGLGYTSGYTADGGLNEGASNLPPANSNTKPLGVNALGLNGYTIPCTGQPITVVRKTPSYPSANWSLIKDSGIIGTNSAGQPIKVYIRDACTSENLKTIVIVSSIHGSENGGQFVSHELLFNTALPPNVRIVAVPELNGYGIPGGIRKNANGVDLNRNNDYNWLSLPADLGGTNYKGAAPGGEPETAAINSFMLALGKVSLSLHYHDNKGYVAVVGNTPVELATIYAQVTGLARGNTSTGIVNQNGSLDAWYNKATSNPVILVELGDDQSQTVINKNVDAIKQLLSKGVI